jgi:hypothetical protein
LTQKQGEIAIAVRQLLQEARPEDEAWADYIDFTRAVARMLDALDGFVPLSDMKPVFDEAWQKYSKLWAAAHKRVIIQSLGGDESLWERVQGHANGRNVVQRILKRVKEQHGAISSAVDASSVEVLDILNEEMPELQ